MGLSRSRRFGSKNYELQTLFTEGRIKVKEIAAGVAWLTGGFLLYRIGQIYGFLAFMLVSIVALLIYHSSNDK
ncbi:MAG: hypothetical protein NUV69_00445 [Candidatus Curtissbacteria bacterium]|nr:hypothetical protein [Candidatus Curtissbacteria bacterium]